MKSLMNDTNSNKASMQQNTGSKLSQTEVVSKLNVQHDRLKSLRGKH